MAEQRIGLQFSAGLFSGVGLIWLLIDIAVFFAPSMELQLKAYFNWYLGICFLYAVGRNFPRSAYSFKVRGRDCKIELRIGDVFRTKGDIVVPFNNQYDASLNGKAAIAPTVQGGLIRKLYAGDAAKLQADIDCSISTLDGKAIKGEDGHYKLGAVVPVKTSRGTAYLFASSQLRDNNRVRGNAEDLVRILPDLWHYIKNEGDKCDLVVPAIGTGHARTVLPREESVEALVKSFIESCAECTYCNKMTVILHPDDVVKHKIDVQYLVKYTQSYCEFARF